MPDSPLGSVEYPLMNDPIVEQLNSEIARLTRVRDLLPILRIRKAASPAGPVSAKTMGSAQV